MIFLKFLSVFVCFSKFLDVFGLVRTHLDAFGCIRMRPDAFGSVWKSSVNFAFLGFLEAVFEPFVMFFAVSG